MQPNRSRLRASLLIAFCSVFVTCSGFVTAATSSCEVHRSNLFSAVSLVLEQVHGRTSLTDRVLVRLEQSEQKESDPWLRDDIRIAWITVLYAARGYADPHVLATYQVLGLHPDKVWPAIEARRRAMLGRSHEAFFGVDSPPKKPAQPVSIDEIGQARKAG